MNKLAILLFACSAWGAQSIVIPASGSITMSVPSVAPFTALGDNQFTFRAHNIGLPGSGFNRQYQLNSINLLVYTNGDICAVFEQGDTQSSRGSSSCVNISGLTTPDVVFRATRFGAIYPTEQNGTSPGSTWLEALDEATGNVLQPFCTTTAWAAGCPIDVTAAPFNSSGASGFIGGTSTAISLAWLKWSSVVVPPGSPISTVESTPADLADFHFEGNCTNVGTGGYAVTLTGTPCGTGFATTPTHSPICMLGGTVQPINPTFRVGQLSQLANYSYPLDGGGTLTHSWSKLSGASIVWSSTTAASPNATFPSLGSYVLQDVVTDSSANSTTCSLKYGAVIADANGIVDTGNPSINQILGTLVMRGANPWAFYDIMTANEMVFQVPNLATYYTPPAAATGTINAPANGATAIVGNSTTFKATFCSGGTSPFDGAVMVIWYVADGIPEGRRWQYVASCTDDTHLTLQSGFNTAGNLPTQSGILSYNVDNACNDNCAGASVYINNSAAPMFYDSCLAMYAEYYRSGIDTYLAAARNCVDFHWSYRMDQGRNYYVGENTAGFVGPTSPRNWLAESVMVRGLDGQPNYLTQFHQLELYAANFLSVHLPWLENGWDAGQNSDARETSDALEVLAMDAPYGTSGSTTRGTIHTIKTTGITPSIDSVTGASALTFYWGNSGGGATHPYDSWSSSTSVSLTHGLTTVTCTGSCGWQVGDFSSTTAMAFFATPGTQPRNNAQMDPQAYFPSWNSSSSLTLDQPYQGTTGSTKGWVLGHGATTPYDPVGIGCQPYMCGRAAKVLYDLGQAMNCVGTNCNLTDAADLKSYSAATANWLKSVGWITSIAAVPYFAGFVNCPAPILFTNLSCTANSTAVQLKTDSTLYLRGIAAGFQATGDQGLRTFGDSVMTAVWGVPGYNGPGGANSGPSFNTGYNLPAGFYMIGTPPGGQAQKYHGQCCGQGANWAWPGIRIGGVIPASLIGTVRSGSGIVGN